MADFVATPSASHWQDQHLDHTSNAFSPDNENPADTFARFANGGASEVEYRGAFQSAADAQEYTTEAYPSAEFGDADYAQTSYKWPTPAASAHQEPISPRQSPPRTPVHQITSPQKLQDSMISQDPQDLGLDDIQEDEDDRRQSAVDRRAEKRKMKRFRLTHNQTRYLMSEFARQAHPDAAHRERLAREIPGLSPRQVQVWFQNRRAKLKRMSSDDRERVMNSRALPDGFPVLQTLNNYTGRMLGTPVASPTDYSPQSGISRKDSFGTPWTNDSASQASNAVNNWGMFTPGASTTSELMTPQSYAGDRAYMSSPIVGIRPGSRANNPYSQSPSANDAFRNRMQVPRLDTHSMARTTISEPLSAPVKSSNAYTGSSLDYSDYTLSAGSHPINALGFVEPPRSVPASGDHANAFVNGYNGYAHAYPSPISATSHHRAGGFPPVAGFPSSHDFGHDSTFAPSPLSRSQTANDGRAADDSRINNLSVNFAHGHKRGRSSSHPPNFAPS